MYKAIAYMFVLHTHTLMYNGNAYLKFNLKLILTLSNHFLNEQHQNMKQPFSIQELKNETCFVESISVHEPKYFSPRGNHPGMGHKLLSRSLTLNNY